GHLTGAIGGEGDAGVGAGDFEVRAGDDGHFHLVVGADDEFGEGGAEGDFAGGGEAGGGGDHVLFGDAAFEELGGEFFGEPFGVGGVFHIGIEADDALVGFAQGDQGCAIGFA